LIQSLRDESANYFSQAERLLSVAQKNQPPSNPGIFSALSWFHKQGIESQQVKFISTEGQEHLTRIFNLCSQLLVLNQRQLELAQIEMNQALDESRRIALATGMTACGLTLLVAAGLTASLMGPLGELLGGVERIERGDLDFEIPITTGGEVGRLTQTFNRMARTVKEQRERLLLETITDGLTGAYNQRHFRHVLKQEIERARRSKESLSLFMIDIDHFKVCNDSLGHEFGNEIIKKVFQGVRDSLREIDFLARYGGDELAVILPNTPADLAQGPALRINSALKDYVLPGLEVLPKGRITLSIGGASFPRDAGSAAELIARADKALYAAKESGRDCVRWAA
jgi:diguanylate cyclase (GGDEF)-like protein